MNPFSFPNTNFRYNERLIKQAACFLLFSSGLRFFYLLRNFEYFSSEKIPALIWAFIIGLRFDVSLLALLMAPLFLFFNLPWKTSILQSAPVQITRRIWLSFIVILLGIPNIADAELLHFTGRRLSFSLLRNSEDFVSMALPLTVHYWYLSLFTILACGTLTLCVSRIQEGEARRPWGVKANALWMIIIVCSLGFVIRGGAQGKPLRPQHAVVYNHSIKSATLSINSAHSLLASYKARALEPVNLIDMSHADLVRRLKESQVFGSKPPEFDNVVVLILESIGKEFLKSDLKPKSDIPFVESLGEQGLLFENNYSNGAISMMAINSVLASVPPLNLGALAYSGYPDTQVNGLPAILKKHGYQSAFFHGGPKGVFYFDTMALHAGFDRYVGQAEFVGQPQLKNYWGIDDDSYLQFVGQQLNQMQEPFLGSAFTLSNHFPYAAPERFLKTLGSDPGPSKYRGARFTDYAVQRFFESIQHYPWFKRTLFVITGDHPAHEKDPVWEKILPVYQMVPLVFYHPGKKLGEGRSLRITQHVDVVPSVLDFLGIGEQEKNSITPFGHSVFQKQIPGRAFVGFESGDFYFIAGDKVNHYNHLTAVNHEYKLSSERLRIDSRSVDFEKDERDFLIKGSLQYFNNGVIGNNLYPMEEGPPGHHTAEKDIGFLSGSFLRRGYGRTCSHITC